MGLTRIQFELPDHKAKHLEQLAEEAGVTKKEFLSNALTLIAWAIRETKSGRVIASVDERNMKYKEVLLPVLENVAGHPKQEQQQQHEAAAIESEKALPK